MEEAQRGVAASSSEPTRPSSPRLLLSLPNLTTPTPSLRARRGGDGMALRFLSFHLPLLCPLSSPRFPSSVLTRPGQPRCSLLESCPLPTRLPRLPRRSLVVVVLLLSSLSPSAPPLDSFVFLSLSEPLPPMWSKVGQRGGRRSVSFLLNAETTTSEPVLCCALCCEVMRCDAMRCFCAACGAD